MEDESHFEHIEEEQKDMSSYLKQQPLLNHQSDMYDSSAHVRVRLLSSKPVPVNFSKCLQSHVQEDRTPVLLKPSTYTSHIEALKHNISSMFSDSTAPLDRFHKNAKTFLGSKDDKSTSASDEDSAGSAERLAEVPQQASPNNIAILRQKGVVMMHIHGGGFVAMSSSSHQNYTRVWAEFLDIPIFSVDYRLSPEVAFPDALNDCWQVYYWLMEDAERTLGIKVNEIILAGDSAGGNLCAALTLLCIKKGYKLPLATILSYPAVYVGPSKFTPSLLFSLDDVLLPTKFLKCCLYSYSGNVVERNPQCKADELDLISPLLAKAEDLAKFPPTLIQVADCDPLRDYGVLFAVKLKKAGARIVKLTEHDNLPHGVLNMNGPIFDLRKEADAMIWQCMDFVNSTELFPATTEAQQQ